MKISFKASLPVSVAEAFAWHEKPGAFDRLNPPWEKVKVLSAIGGISDGAKVKLKVPVLGPLTQTWQMRHEGFIRGLRFCDVMERGPFSFYRHEHQFKAIDEINSELHDQLEFKLPLDPVGTLLGGWFVHRKLTPVFRYRHSVLIEDLRRHKEFSQRPRKKIAISGATGLVGSNLASFLTSGGHQVFRLVRKKTNLPDEIYWDPESNQIEREKFEGLDAVVHLAGENIAARRWSAAQKKRLLESRVKGTKLISQALASLSNPPKVFISASAVGFYGSRQEQELAENSGPGTGFLAEICQAWEAATESAKARGIRVVNPRIGVVLSPAGGALQKMLLPFKLGLGGTLGSGKQWISWIGLHDLIYLLHQCLMREDISGPINAVAPEPVTNAQFTKALGSVLLRPTIFPVPAWLLKLLLGEMADALLLASTKALPEAATTSGFKFSTPDISSCLRLMLGKDQLH